MPDYYHPLSLTVDTLIRDFNAIPNLPSGKDFCVAGCDPKSFLHDDVYKKLSELGTLGCLMFSMVSGADKKSIHVDMDHATGQHSWPGLNIVLEGQGVMRWFNPVGPGVVLKHPTANVLYRVWDTNYGEPIDEWNTGKVVLVRVDVPHQTWNFDSETRKIVSIRWSNRLSWEETIEWFHRNFPSC